jgi:hypothetical protein
VEFLRKYALPRRFSGSKATQKDLAAKIEIPRKTLNDQLNKTKWLSPAVFITSTRQVPVFEEGCEDRKSRDDLSRFRHRP